MSESMERHSARKHSGCHVVFLFQQGSGHILPTLPLVSAMTGQGIQVTYFASDDSPVLKEAVLAAGAQVREYRRDSAVVSDDRLAAALCPFVPPLLEDLRALQPPPSVLVYDPFYPVPLVAGQVLAVPAVALVLNTGPGCTVDMETAAYAEMFQATRKWLQDTHDVDVFQFGIPMSSWYSPVLNIVLTSEEFFEGPADEKQRQKFGHLRFECVGSLVNPKTTSRPPMPGFPLDDIKAAQCAGKKVVLLSLGSAVTSILWTRPCPLTQGNDDGTEYSGKTIGAMTGKEISHFVWKTAFDALGDNEDLLVAMVTGEHEDALEGLSLPGNFLAFAAVPQLEVLPLCGAFITHGGMGSTMEALAHEVPMVVVPVFGDQMSNADNAAKLGIGLSFRYPLRTLSVATLGESVRSLLQSGPESPFRIAAKAAAAKMSDGGGAKTAIEHIFEAAGL